MAASSLAKSGISSFARYQKTSVGNAGGTPLFVMGGAYVNTTGYSTSTDGITWTLRSNTGMGSSYGVIKKGSVYTNMTASNIYGIADPVAGSSFRFGQWTALGVNNTFRGCDYLNNDFQQWGDYGFGSGAFMVDSGASVLNYTGLAYGNNTWVITRNGGIYYATGTSEKNPAGLTYTSTTSNLTTVYAVTFGNGVFVATGSNGISSSTDGITWTKRASAGTNNFNGSRVIFAGGIFLSMVNSGVLYTSADGTTWTAQTPNNVNSVLVGAAYGAGVWTIVAGSGLLWSSPDGTTWTSRTNPQAGNNWWSSYGASVILYG
jgi:hypothetical protein